MPIKNVTTVILTNRNDKRFITALQSAQIAESCIIIDNNSQNEWEKLRKEFNFKLIKYPEKIADFSKIKNAALEEVKTEWVLFLDSDEVLSKNAEECIENVVQQNLFDAVSIKRVDYFLGKPLLYGEAGSLPLVRLFKTNKGKFKRNIHEVVETQGKIGEADFQILHFSHESIKSFLEKITLYSQIESKNKKTLKNETIFQMIFFPIGKFILNYFLKFGFLDGFRGLIYAIIMSLHSFFVRIFYYENL